MAIKYKGTPGSWYQDDEIGGYYDVNGHLVVCEEYGLSDADCDRYAAEVMNGTGYYDDFGKFHYFRSDSFDED